MRHTLVLAVVIAVLTGTALVRLVHTGSPQVDTTTVMRLKLDYAQAILRSIAVEDFAQLERQARELAKLTETAAWQVLQTSEYRRQSAEFLRIAESLADAAEERNSDAAALDYVALTLQCVQCHKHVRGQRQAFGIVPAGPSGSPRSP